MKVPEGVTVVWVRVVAVRMVTCARSLPTGFEMELL